MSHMNDHRRWHGPFRSRGERGSVVLALLAVIVIGGFVVALFMRTTTNQRAARFDRDFQEVVHHADAGVQQGLFMLEADQFINVEPGDPPQSFTLDVDGNTVNWEIERINSRSWEITSTSDLNGVTRTVVATLEERRRFFASAFAQLLAEFNNNNFADTYKSNNEASPYGEDVPYWPRPGRLGIVGSNTEVKFGGKSSMIDGVQIWNFKEGDTVADRCTGAGNTQIALTSSDAIGLTDPDYDPDGVLTACEPDAFVRPDDSLLGPYSVTFPEERVFVPSNDDLVFFLDECDGDPDNAHTDRQYPDFDNTAGKTHEAITTLEPVTAANAATLRASGFVVVEPQDRNGDSDTDDQGEEGFYCFDDITFGQDTFVDASASQNNPVAIYTTGTVNVYGPGTGTQRLVNCEHCMDLPKYGTDTTSKPPPVAAALQINFVAVDGNTPTFRMSSHSRIGATLYAPSGVCGNTGSSGAAVYGSMLCDQINNTGGWQFHYDDALTVIGSGEFTVAAWREETD